MIMAQSQGTDIEILANDKEFKILNSASIYAYVDKAYDTKINNNTSALYKFQYNDTDICFTGDMSINQEYAYLDYGDDLDCDLLLVSHHGSKTGSYYKILELYSPEYSIISVSDNKLFGLPNENVVNRLKEYSRVLCDSGVLIVAYAGEKHLLGLKSAIYENAHINTQRADLPLKMCKIWEKRVSYNIDITSNNEIMSLFAMTPYYWRTSQSDAEKLMGLEKLTTEVDIVVSVYTNEKTEMK
jgi:hypothetical protein